MEKHSPYGYFDLKEMVFGTVSYREDDLLLNLEENFHTVETI